MDAIYYLIADNGPTLAPVVLAACWYGFVAHVVSTDDERYRPVRAERRGAARVR
jgi:hypothetical protein